VTGIITGFKDYISQSGIANLNGVQYLLRGIYWITNPSEGSPEQWSPARKNLLSLNTCTHVRQK